MVTTGFFLNSSLVNDDITTPAARDTVEVISSATGIVREIGEGETAVYMIDCRAKHLRLNVYNMPGEFKKNGMQVKFSGNIKAGSTLEDDFGECFEITAVEHSADIATNP